MALTFGDKLFEGISEEDKLKPRYLQDDSTIVNRYQSTNADGTNCQDTPTNKKMYITEITVQVGSAQTLQILDGSGGTQKGIIVCPSTTQTYTVVFQTPLELSVGLFLNWPSKTTVIASWKGWIE